MLFQGKVSRVMPFGLPFLSLGNRLFLISFVPEPAGRKRSIDVFVFLLPGR